MNIKEIVTNLQNQNVVFTLVNGELKIQAPKHVITPEIQKILSSNKSQIIDILQNKKLDMDFSLFFFADSINESDNYNLILEVAKFADKNGFKGIWTPERHFHRMGGIYPNPAIMAGALAMITENLILRAGSVVLPTNDPIRVVENWSVVDNLSKGRVELSVASGWHVNDFVFFPENYPKRKEIMFERVDTIKKLWKGEKIVRKNGANKEIEIEVYPRPYQKELTIWSTAIGNPETYVESAKRGLNIMTCLLDQEIPELKEKIALYRKTLKEYGHNPEEKKVAVFLHTFVGDSVESVKETIKTPFMNYLKTTLDLIGKFVQNADIPVDPSKMAEEEKEALLEFAFERYFTSRTLLGDIERVKEIAFTLKEIGVDEIACLVDFGLDSTQIMDSLKKLSLIVS